VATLSQNKFLPGISQLSGGAPRDKKGVWSSLSDESDGIQMCVLAGSDMLLSSLAMVATLMC
jgi:hypothetical protein